MSHIWLIVASAVGAVGGVMGILAYLIVRRRRAFEDYVTRRSSDRARLGGRTTDELYTELPSRLQDLAKRKAEKWKNRQ